MEAQEIYAVINRRDHIKLRSFCTVTETQTKRKKATDWEKTFVSYANEKALITMKYKKLKKLNNKINSPVKNGQRRSTGIFQSVRLKWPTDK